MDLDVSHLAPSNKTNIIKVLEFDDDPSILEITKLMLMDIVSSLDIDNASSVDEAFKKLTTDKYDIVVSDYEMPLKNGLELLKELREQQRDIPSILFTVKGSGLVLNMIKKMIDVYRWKITEEGEPGKGAKFTKTIPRLSNYKKDCQNLKGVFESGQ